MLVLITGKPNVGKTTVVKLLANKYETFIADEYVKSIYQVGGAGYALIKQHFGDQYVTPYAVDTQALGALVHQDQTVRIKLNQLIWPLLKKELLTLKQSTKNYIVELAIYLVDSDGVFANIFDKVILLTAAFKISNDKQKHNDYYDQIINNWIDSSVVNESPEQACAAIEALLLKWNFI